MVYSVQATAMCGSLQGCSRSLMEYGVLPCAWHRDRSPAWVARALLQLWGTCACKRAPPAGWWQRCQQPGCSSCCHQAAISSTRHPCPPALSLGISFCNSRVHYRCRICKLAKVGTGLTRSLVQPPAMTAASSAAAIGIQVPTLRACASKIALTNRLQAGEPPTEEAEREWQRILRERQQLADMREQVHIIVLQLLPNAPACVCCLSMLSTNAGTMLSHTDGWVTGCSCV